MRAPSAKRREVGGGTSGVHRAKLKASSRMESWNLNQKQSFFFSFIVVYSYGGTTHREI